MKLIKPSFEIWEQEPSLEGIYKQIERAGRVCYKSEDKIAEGTAKAFVDRMIARGHGAMLEHGTVYLMAKTKLVNYYIHPEDGEDEEYNPLEKYYQNEYSYINNDDTNLYVTTNLRVLVENGWLNDLEYQCEPTEYHEKRITVKFVCDRGVSHEFVRHRVFSFAQESTRYCNYSKAKFGKELNCIIPCWYKNMFEGNSYNIELCHTYDLTISEGLSRTEAAWIQAMCEAESTYFGLLTEGEPAQQARNVLPLALKTELIMTGTIEQWKGFFKLRDAGSAHPQAYELAHPLHEEFIKRGYVAI